MQLIVVPEEVIKDACQSMLETEPNNTDNGFLRVLESANIYRYAEMTPFFLLNPQTMDIMVAAKETWGKKLH